MKIGMALMTALCLFLCSCSSNRLTEPSCESSGSGGQSSTAGVSNPYSATGPADGEDSPGIITGSFYYDPVMERKNNSGILVSLAGPGISAFTDTSGMVTFAGLPAGTYELKAETAGFAPVTVTASVDESGKIVLEAVKLPGSRRIAEEGPCMPAHTLPYIAFGAPPSTLLEEGTYLYGIGAGDYRKIGSGRSARLFWSSGDEYLLFDRSVYFSASNTVKSVPLSFCLPLGWDGARAVFRHFSGDTLYYYNAAEDSSGLYGSASERRFARQTSAGVEVYGESSVTVIAGARLDMFDYPVYAYTLGGVTYYENMEGGGGKAGTGLFIKFPAWHNPTRRLAFNEGNDYRIRFFDATAGAYSEVSVFGSRPMWTNDGKLLYSGPGGLYLAY